MRALFATAIFVSGIAGLGVANAADLQAGRSVHYAYTATVAVRAGQYVIWDNEPGVYVRAYWSAPWQNRHYFPFTGKRPKVGRFERLSAVGPATKPAASFYREWSTISLFPPNGMTPPPDNAQPLVVIEQPAAVPSVPMPLK